jgi:cyanuric acid amidohydrolase
VTDPRAQRHATISARAWRIATAGPSDTSGLERLIDAGELDPAQIVCVIGKTEGNGGRNDFTRELAQRALEELLATRLRVERSAVAERVVLSLSGGCEGVISPHLVVVAVAGESTRERLQAKRLAVATGHTRELAPHEIGRMAQVEETARVVRALAQRLRLDAPSDVHLVQLKGAVPAVSWAEQEAATAAGRPLRSDMPHSRAASALGVALALGEVPPDALSDEAICRDWSLYSGVASCSAKPGLRRSEIVMLANSAYWDGDLQIAHGVLEDMLDVRSVRETLARLGIRTDPQPDPSELARIVGVFAKSEADPRRLIRGQRQVMLDDDDVDDTRWSRCVLGAVLAAVLGHTAVYVSTRAEHHGPLGGGTLAVIARAGGTGSARSPSPS